MGLSNNKNNKLLGFLGMRVVKTAIAVYICFLFSLPRGNSPFYSAIAAIISMKNDTEESMNTGKNRIMGTLIGGIFGLLTILLIDLMDIGVFSHLHYVILSITLIPVIYANVKFYSPSSTTISCVVFLSIAVSHIKDTSPFMFAINRTVETSIGVIISVIVNKLL